MTRDAAAGANRRSQVAHERAANTHDHAQRLHQDAADLFDRHGQPDLALRERAAARREAAAAQTERHHADELRDHVSLAPVSDGACAANVPT